MALATGNESVRKEIGRKKKVDELNFCAPRLLQPVGRRSGDRMGKERLYQWGREGEGATRVGIG